MPRSLPGQGRVSGHSVWGFIQPWRSTSKLCPFLKLHKHKRAPEKKLEEKYVSFLPAVCLFYAFDSALYCGGYFSLPVHNWWVNREEAEPHMYNLTEFRWKKKRADYEKNEHFLNWFQKKRITTRTPVIPFCLTKSTELLMKGKDPHFHLSHEGHCPSWGTACTFLPQCFPESFCILRLRPGLSAVTAVPWGWDGMQ